MSDISYNAYMVAAEFLVDVYKDESFFVFIIFHNPSIMNTLTVAGVSAWLEEQGVIPPAAPMAAAG